VTPPDDIHGDLPPDLDPLERDHLATLGARLQSQRPVPAAAFRGELRRRIVTLPGSRRVRRQAAILFACGCALLGVAAIGVAGAGPLSQKALASDQTTVAAIASDR
jgi:hypothetical protein